MIVIAISFLSVLIGNFLLYKAIGDANRSQKQRLPKIEALLAGASMSFGMIIGVLLIIEVHYSIRNLFCHLLVVSVFMTPLICALMVLIMSDDSVDRSKDPNHVEEDSETDDFTNSEQLRSAEELAYNAFSSESENDVSDSDSN